MTSDSKYCYGQEMNANNRNLIYKTYDTDTCILVSCLEYYKPWMVKIKDNWQYIADMDCTNTIDYCMYNKAS